LTLSEYVIGAKIQARVVRALILREIHTRYGRDNIGFLWIFAEPGMFCLGVTLMWSALRPAHEHGVPVVAFVITGYTPLILWRHCVTRSILAFEANGSLLFHRQVTPLDIIFARLMLEICGTISAFVLVEGGAIVMGFMDPPVDLGLFYLGNFYNILFSVGCGLTLAGLSQRYEVIERFAQVFTYLSIPFSGAFSMVDWVPPKFQNILLYSPSVHAFELIRAGQFGPSVRTHYDIVYVSWTCALLILIGLSLTLRSRRYIIVQ
jgi:capsular polysaccharide transport system permease protein